MLSELLKNNKSSLLILLVTLILPLSASSASVVFLSQNEAIFLNFSLVQWSLFYLITAITMSLALTPSTYIALISGYFIGWAGLFGLIPSYLLASLIGYYLAGKLDKGDFLNHLNENKKIKNVMVNLKNKEFLVIFFCRISPATPFAMMNIFLSFMKVNLINFITGSISGMLPRTVLMVWIGTQANDVMKMLRREGEPDLSKLLVIALLVFSIVGLYVIFMRALKKTSPNNS